VRNGHSGNYHYIEGVACGYLVSIFLNIGQLIPVARYAELALEIFRSVGAVTDAETAEQLLASIEE